MSPRLRSVWSYTWKVGGLLLVLLVVVVGGLLYYASTERFSQFVRQRVIAVLEDATGGRVEMQQMRWSVRHFSVEVDGLTIHGLEGPGEMPYAHVERLLARARILSFFHARLGLDFLEVDRPAIHLIIYADGHTNQPAPKAKQKGDEPEYEPDTRTIFDLQANRVEVHDGLARVNERVLPFQLAANNMNALVTYAPGSQHYLGELNCSDINLQKGKGPVVHSQLNIQLEAATDSAELKQLHFSTAKTSLAATGSLAHFADPEWKLAGAGTVDLGEVADLGGLDGLRRGTLDLSLGGGGRGTSQFALDGNARLNNVGYAIPYVIIEGLNVTTNLHITPTEIILPDALVRPRDGGVMKATIRYLNWLEPDTPPASKAGKRSASTLVPAMTMRTRVHDVRLSTVMHIFVLPGYQDIGYDTLGDGPVNIDWTGDASDFTIAANLTMSAPRSSAPGELPLTGMADAKYSQLSGMVTVSHLQAYSPATALTVSGSLGVYPTNRPSNLSIHLINHDLGEFDQVLKTLELGVNGKRGISGLPVQLHGDATFDGVGEGSLDDPAFHGRLTAGRFSTAFVVPAMQLGRVVATHGAAAALPKPGFPRPVNLSWDHLEATVGYSSSLISIEQGTVTRGHTVVHASGQLQAHRLSRKRLAFDDASPVTAAVQMQNASVSDLLSVAGQDLPIPLTGNMNLQAHVGGTLGDLSGGGDLTVQGGAIAGQPYQSLTATVNLAGQDIQLLKLALSQYGGMVVVNGNYNLKAGTFLANLDGSNFDLAHLPQPKDARLSLAGALKFDAHASGTFEAPSILAGIHMRNLVLGGQPAGGLEVTAHTQGNTAYFTAQNSLTSTHLQLMGQTVLQGDFESQAEMVLSSFDIAPFLRILKVQSISGNSAIGGDIKVAGPLRDPKRFSGEAQITEFAVNLQGVPLQTVGPLHASLHQGTLSLTQAHITGPDTDLSLSGTAQLDGEQDLAVSGKGALNMKLAQTLDPDITSSGHVEFNVDAGGTLTKPLFSGRLHVTNVALALNDLPNGISHLNGNLIFDQNRLTVQDLVGTTGGGQLKFGGFLAYQQGIYGDFTANGKDIRVRYSGISATADTSLHLQGSQNSMLLSGSVQITRFIIGPNVDFASFATGPSATIPPDPNAPSSHVRLDVHIFSAPQLDFQNSYAQLAGSVDLRVRGTVAQPAILGRINITDGTANFAGTTYRLQRGQIFFTNPVMIQPIIDIDATTRIEEYDVTIGLHGSSNQLTPTFRSEPPLPQADVISLLALGRTQEEQQLYSQQEQSVGADSTTNALLGGALNAAVGSRVQKLFGGGSVKIDPTYVGTIGNSSARITVQQNISRNVQVTYATNVNATAQQLIQAQVDVSSSVSVLAVRDEAGVFSMVLKVHKRFR